MRIFFAGGMSLSAPLSSSSFIIYKFLVPLYNKAMTEELKKTLQELADKYEVASFCDQDPSQFLRWYSEPEFVRGDVEAASFLAAMLAFGSRKQFIPKIRSVLEKADSSCGSFSRWLCSRAFEKDFPHGSEKFYRFYSYDDMQSFFGEMADILSGQGDARKCGLNMGTTSFGEYFHKKWKADERLHLADIISQSFPKSKIVPKGSSSANKRIHMFLRWMVRRNSPVDLGLWTWYSPANLLIPLDVHVMQEAARLDLLPSNAPASHRTALLLTEELAQVFPGDPCRADFSLFGLGVS